MSKVLIFSTKWIHENAAYPKGIVFKNKVARCEHPLSDFVYEQALIQSFLFNDSSISVADMYGIEENIQGISFLISVAKALLSSGYGDKETLEEDIDNADWGDLLQDIYDTLNNNRDNKDLINIISSYIPTKHIPLCYELREDEYLAIGISPLPYKTAGDQFCDDWARALISDFTEKNDSVILALHGSTDWDHPDKTGYGYMHEYSKSLSNETEREVHVHVYQHVNFDYIAEAIQMEDEHLSVIWEHIIKHGKE